MSQEGGVVRREKKGDVTEKGGKSARFPFLENCNVTPVTRYVHNAVIELPPGLSLTGPMEPLPDRVNGATPGSD